MNRPLKFRVWDKELNKFVTGYDIDCGMWREVYSDPPAIFFDGLKYLQEDERYIIQQHTGLTDSKGKEIYEGDILKINDHLLPEKVIFLFGSFGFHLNYKNSKDPRRKDNDSADFYSISEFHDLELEVIGNIFEHEHLLR